MTESPPGSDLVFAIPTCRFIIHAVGPIYIDGRHGEREQLERCYRSILSLAREHGCQSLAIPSISTGFSGYPKAEAYSIATSIIREFLLSLPDDEDLMVYMVLYNREDVALSEKVEAAVEQFISDSYIQDREEQLKAIYEKPQYPELVMQTPYPPAPQKNEEAGDLAFLDGEPEDSTAAPEEPGAGYEKEDRSFAEMCEWWCGQKGISKNEFYTRSNINKAMFWGIKHHPEQIPKKTNALACVIGLKLNYDQAIDLLGRAGLTLSKYYETDVIVEYFIRNRNYDIDEINLALYKKDLVPLGSF